MTDPHVVLTDRYAEAVAFASRIHATQTRKGKDTAYVCHLLGVSALVIEAGGNEDEAIAGLLHDAAEDCGGEDCLLEIERRFGVDVARIVRGCSDSLTADRDEKVPWLERKRTHLAHLRDAGDDVALVTAADNLHNARAIWTDLQLHGIDTLSRFNAEPWQIAWYYKQMLAILVAKGVSQILTLPLTEIVSAMAPILKECRNGTVLGLDVSDAPRDGAEPCL